MIKPKYSDIKVEENKYQHKIYDVTISSPEFSCVCPKTGLPDFATIETTYSPDKYLVELKSFKLYLMKYRNLGIFHEHAVNQIYEDFKRACSPRDLRVNGLFRARGGITTAVCVES